MTVAEPVIGAIHFHQTDAPPTLSAWFGSPGSLVAPRFVPVTVVQLPLIVVACRDRRARVLQPAERDVALLHRAGVVTVDRDLVDRRVHGVEGDARPAGAAPRCVVVRCDRRQRADARARVDAEQRVEARAKRRDRDRPGLRSRPRVPDRRAALVAGVVRLTGLLVRADVRAGRGARGAADRLRGGEVVVRRPCRQRSRREQAGPDRRQSEQVQQFLAMWSHALYHPCFEGTPSH